MDILDRTKGAIGENLINKLRNRSFCIIGCGGTGALFAEMLVRSGARKIILIDGDEVECSNLNRVVGFDRLDIGKKKVDVLKTRFKNIRSDIEIELVGTNFRQRNESDPDSQKARDAVCDSDVIIITVDKNCIRIECEKLAREYNKQIIGIGVFVNEGGNSGFECTWKPNTPEDTKDNEGYGVGSYISIVVEATSVAFSMLLHHLENPESDQFRYYYKEYKNFLPHRVEIDESEPYQSSCQ